jgi:hypothetical protein
LQVYARFCPASRLLFWAINCYSVLLMLGGLLTSVVLVALYESDAAWSMLAVLIGPQHHIHAPDRLPRLPENFFLFQLQEFGLDVPARGQRAGAG